jgi:prepilin-type processing-associated H-X9-DG protein
MPLTYRKKMTDFASTSTTFVFSDSALIASWANPPTAQESYSIAAPQTTLAGSAVPTTHFRHLLLANVAFLDGHVEPLGEVPVASPSGWSTAANDLRAQLHIGYLADTTLPYAGK